MDFNLVDYNSTSNELKSGNWKLRSSNTDVWKNAFKYTHNCYELCDDRQAICFKKDVNEFGTYKLTVTFKATNDEENHISVYIGRRNLVKHKLKCNSNESLKIEFYTHVTPYIPALTYMPEFDKAIYISFIGKNVCIENIEAIKEDAKTIFIAGDSTLTDQNALTPYYPISSCAGWAQDLTNFVKDFAVCNYAHSGLTTNCFRDDGHWDILKKHFKAGDFFIIQFGHNDQKRRNLLPFDGYKKNLIWYVNEIRALGGFPIICSPISRVPITDETETYSLLLDYAIACKEVSNELNVPFIDLHTFTFDKWKSLSSDEVKNYFIPGDITHTNDYGAILIAEYVARELSKLELFTDKILLQDMSYFNPDSDVKEFPIEKFSTSPFDKGMNFLDNDEIVNYEKCNDAFKKGLMDPCVMHIHPRDYIPRAQLLMLLLRALRLNGTRPYVGSFKDISKYEWDSSYIQTCINDNLIDASTVTEDSFRPNDYLTYSEFASFCIRGLEKNYEKRKALNLIDCEAKAKELNIIKDTVTGTDFITREEMYIGLALCMDLENNTNSNMPSDTEIHPVH